MCSGRPRRLARTADSVISRPVTENGEHGATAIWTRAPGPLSCRDDASRSRVGEHGVELLDELVGRQPAVRDAEVHGAARRDEPQPDLAGRLHLGLDQAVASAREEVVVVEDRRAAGQRQLGKAGSRRRVLRLGVEPGPDGVQLPQPGEEVGLLRPCARERLKEVVVRVDEAGSDDGPAEVDDLVRVRPLAVADRRDDAVLDQHPPACVLCPLVVHGDDVTVREQGAHPSLA